jgi:hypothetical protein
VVRWGESDNCEVPTVMAFPGDPHDPGSPYGLETLAELEPPSGLSWTGCSDFTCRYARFTQAGDTLLLSLIWGNTQAIDPDDANAAQPQLVALTTDGELRWSTPGHLDFVASTEDAVVGVRGESWRVLRLSDGRELASDDFTEHELAGTELSNVSPGIPVEPASDGTRLYSVGGVNVVVRSVDDLSVLATVPVDTGLGPRPGVIARDGKLIVTTSELSETNERENALRIVALTDP